MAQAVEAAELAAGEPVGPGVVAKGGVAEAALSMCVEGEERGRGATFCEAHVEAISRGVDGEAPVSEVSVEDAASVGHGKSGEADAVSRGGGGIAAAGSVGAVKLVAQGELETVRVEGHRAEELFFFLENVCIDNCLSRNIAAGRLTLEKMHKQKDPHCH